MTPEDESLPDADLTPPDDLDARLRNLLVLGLSDSEAGKDTAPGSRPSKNWDPPPVERLQRALPQFEFHELIGRGGMGAVYLARQLSLDRMVAVKVLPGDILDEVDANFVQRFENEARTMGRMNHPGIVNVIDFGKTDDLLLYFVMEYVPGTDVAQLVKAKGKLPPLHALSIVSQVCDALGYAHGQGVIHRDIKPANVLISPDGRVKIADFGLAKVLNQDIARALTISHLAIGTPDYTAPEALVAGKPTDHRVDLYAVGVMLYNMLTGEIPRGRFKLPSEKVKSDPRFDEIINHALETEREDRYQSATEIRKDLDRIRSSAWVKKGEVLEPEIVTDSIVVRAFFPESGAELAVVGSGGEGGRSTRKLLVMTIGAVLIGGGILFGVATRSGGVKEPPGNPKPLSIGQGDRAAVLMVLGKGGRAVVEHGSGEKLELRSAALLPSGDVSALELRIAGSNEVAMKVTAEDMRLLKGLSKLTSLELHNTDVTDEMLQVLGGMKSLRTLFLRRCVYLTDVAMTHVSFMTNLRVLSLDSTYGVTNAGILALKELTQIEELGISNMPKVDESVLPVLLGMKKLWSLQVHNSVWINKDFIEQLGELPALKELSVSIGQLEPVPEMDRLKALQRLKIYGYQESVRLTSTVIEGLGRCNALEQLQLGRLVKLDEPGLEQMARIPWLKSLQLENVELPPSGMASMQSSALEKLEIGPTDRLFDDQDLISLGGITSLREVKLAQNGAVRAAGVRAFSSVRSDVLLSK